MKILVVGGAGYIGAHAVRALAEAGAELVVLDDLSTGHREAVPPGVPLVLGDVRDASAVDRALEGVDAVMHFAAQALVGPSTKDPLFTYELNVAGTLTLLSRMAAAGVGSR